MKNPINIINYAPFIFRRRFKKKYIIIESDDWGLIGPSSRESILFLGKKYGKDNFTRWTTDSIESTSDLELLFDLLDKYKNSFMSKPIITSNFITHNINYENTNALAWHSNHARDTRE